MKILIVDDREENLLVLETALKSGGHTVRRAADGLEALASLRAEPAEAVISDILMPNMDGFRLCHEMRKDAALQAVPFLFYTSTYDSPGDRETAAAVGADAYLLKPSPAEALLAALDEAVRKAAGRRRKPPAAADESEVIKRYNVSLVAKLEERNEELTRAVAALQATEERFRQLADNVEEVFWMRDIRDDRILYVSPAYEGVWGRPCAELYARPKSWLDAVLPEDRARVVEGLAHDSFDHEYRIRRPDGSVRWIRDRAFPIRDAQGRIHRVVGLAGDITERKQLESQFLRAQRLDIIGTLASGIAHDLNNILAPMVIAAGMLKMKAASADEQRVLSMIESGAQRGAAIIRQLLGFSRGAEGLRIVVQPKHLFDELMSIMRETFPRHLAIEAWPDPDLGTVRADPTQLHQVLMNLCVNARDAMPERGTLTLRGKNLLLEPGDPRLPAGASPGPYVVLTVADTGTGIAPENLPRIFDPFFTTKGEGKGTGLGLATVASIVKSHRGFATLESEPGKGTAFHIHLPAAEDMARRPAPGEPEPAPRGRGELILVVDDEEPIRVYTQDLLERNGYRVVLAANGEEAVKLFIEHRGSVALVLTDLMMPLMDGQTLIRALRILDPAVKIIVTTGLNQNGSAEGLPELGASAVVMKPAPPRVLLETIAGRLARRA